MLDADRRIQHLDQDRQQILAAFVGVTPAEARFRPASGGWSALEVLGHLLDEEREDFGARLRSTLLDPGREWPDIDPVRWVAERSYQDQDLGAQLEEFDRRRRESVAWLGSLDNPDWTLTRTHSAFGDIRAGDLLLSWVTHDLLHLAQLVRIRMARVAEGGAPFSAAYALP